MQTHAQCIPCTKPLERFLKTAPTPLFLYDEKSLVQAAQALFRAFSGSGGFLPRFPVRMNPNPAVLRLLHSCGCGVLCRRRAELELAAQCGFSGGQIAYEPLLRCAEAEETAHALGAVFVLDGEPTTFRFWDGEPYAEGSTMIGERVYHKPKQWNVYQPDTFKLDKLLRGIGRFAVELNVKVHIKGFTFTRHSRAWDTLAAGACDAVYGDSFTRDGSRVLGIGNNVSLLFDRMDFGETGCCGIRITGRSPLPANTVHLMFAAADGGETERRVVEFGPQADWGEQTFTFEPVTGARQVTFLFLPGTQFDFDSFTFI